jgi:hypothetical protein
MLNQYLLLQAQLQCGTFQLLLAETKEYEANWLENQKTVLRDGSGRFAKAGQELKDVATYGVEEHNRRMAFEQFGSQLKDLAGNVSVATTDFTQSIPKYAAEISSRVQSTPELFEAAKDFTFGGGYKDTIESLIEHFHEIKDELRRAATKKYKEFEPKLQKMKGKEFEQAIQDELIKLQVLQKRSLLEDIKDIDSPDDVQKVFKEHQADFLAAATSVVWSVLVAVDPQVLSNVILSGVVAAVTGQAFIPIFMMNFGWTLAFETSRITPMVVADLLIKNTDAEKNKEKIHSVINTIVVAAYLLPLTWQIPKVVREVKNAQQAQAARNAEAAEALESLLAKLGVDSVPQTKDELKKAYYKMSKKLHPDLGGKEEDFIKMQKAYEEVSRRLKF